VNVVIAKIGRLGYRSVWWNSLHRQNKKPLSQKRDEAVISRYHPCWHHWWCPTWIW